MSLDCPDPSALAAFYARLLGTEIAYESEVFAALRPGTIWLTVRRVDNYEPPTWPTGALPKQLHLDMAVADLDEGEAVVLGGRSDQGSCPVEPGTLASAH